MTCPKCDRVDCDVAVARGLFLREDHYGHQMRLHRAEQLCEQQAVDWRSRAIAAEAEAARMREVLERLASWDMAGPQSSAVFLEAMCRRGLGG